MSPELFDPEGFDLKDGRPTDNSDCYALGMVVYEVLSGQLPFFRHRGCVVLKIAKGERPERPQGVEGVWFTDDVWGILEGCWRPIPADRPRIKDVLQCLESVSRFWVPPPQTVTGPSVTDPAIPVFDFSTEESMNESEISSSLQVIPSQLPQDVQNGNSDENNTLNSSHKFSVTPCGAPDHQDLGMSAENPNGPDSKEPAVILDTVS